MEKLFTHHETTNRCWQRTQIIFICIIKMSTGKLNFHPRAAACYLALTGNPLGVEPNLKSANRKVMYVRNVCHKRTYIYLYTYVLCVMGSDGGHSAVKLHKKPLLLLQFGCPV